MPTPSLGQAEDRIRPGRVPPRGRPVRAGLGQVQGQRDVPPRPGRPEDAGPVQRGLRCLRRAWGRLKIGYDPAVFPRAVDLFARASDRFRDSETYRLDLVALRTQALSNEAYDAYAEIAAALGAGDRAAVELLGPEPFYRLGTYQSQAIRYGDTPEERRNSLRNAMMLVTYWAGSDASSDDRSEEHT